MESDKISLTRILHLYFINSLNKDSRSCHKYEQNNLLMYEEQDRHLKKTAFSPTNIKSTDILIIQKVFLRLISQSANILVQFR